MNKGTISLIIFAILALVIPQSAFAGNFSVSYSNSNGSFYYSNYNPYGYSNYRPSSYYNQVVYYPDIVYPVVAYPAYPVYYPAVYYPSSYYYNPSYYYPRYYVPNYTTSPPYNFVGPSIAPYAAYASVRIEKQ